MTEPDVQHLFRTTRLHPPLDGLDVDRAVREGRRRRRRRAAAALASVAVVVVAAGTVALTAVSAGRGGPPPAASPVGSAPPSPNPNRTGANPSPSVSYGHSKAPVPSDFASPPRSLPNSTVIKVDPGERVDIGGGAYLTLNSQQKCVTFPDDPGFAQCKSLTDGNQARGSVSMQGRGDSSRTYVTGVYTARDAVKVVYTHGSQHWVMTIVKLRDGGRNVAYFLTLPAGTLTFEGDDQITVYNREGKPVTYLHQPRR